MASGCNLVGGPEELAAIENARSATIGRGVVFHGRAAVGTSRLAHEAHTAAARDGGQTGRATGERGGGERATVRLARYGHDHAQVVRQGCAVMADGVVRRRAM